MNTANNGPNWGGNYVQPNTSNPTPNPQITTPPPNGNPMALTFPVPPPAPHVTDNPPNPQPLGIFPHLTS